MDSLDSFIDKNVNCGSCRYWERVLWGGNCVAPELSCGPTKSSSCCEQHEFYDKNLENEMETLIEEWYNAQVWDD